MKALVGLASLLMLSSLGAGFLLSHGPELQSVRWDRSFSEPPVAWSDDVRLTYAPLDSERPSAARDLQGNLHLVWTDTRAGESDIYYKKVGLDGRELVPEKRLSPSMSQSRHPAIAVDAQGFLHVAWMDNRGGSWNVYYSKLAPTGQVEVEGFQVTSLGPFSEPASDGPLPRPVQRLNHLSAMTDSEGLRPSMDVDLAGNAHIAWCDYRDGNAEVRYTVLSPDGELLADQERISRSPSDAYHAVVKVWGDEVVMLWAERPGETNQIFYARLDRAGHRLVEPVAVVSEVSQRSELAAVQDPDGSLWLARTSTEGSDRKLRISRLLPDGSLSGEEVLVARSLLDSANPSVALDRSGNLLVAWNVEEDRLDQQHPLSDIWFARYGPEGQELEPPRRMTDAQHRSWGPHLSFYKDDLPLLVWSDNREGASNTEIFMTRQLPPDGAVQEVQPAGEAVREVSPGENYVPAAAAVGGTGILLAVVMTDLGKFKLGLLAVPLYSRLRKQGILNHAVREQIFGYVTSHPGANFSQIMRELDLKNGVLAYHLTTLEREELIRSLRDGTYRRYYPRTQRGIPFELEKAVLAKIEQVPGVPQNELPELLGLNRQLVDYHLESLIQSGRVRMERRGKKNLCFATRVAG